MKMKLSLIISVCMLALLVLPTIGLATQVRTTVYTYNSTSGFPAIYADKIELYNSTGYKASCTSCKELLAWPESGKTYYVNITKKGYNPILAKSISITAPGPISSRHYLNLDTQNPRYANQNANPSSPATYAKDASYNFRIDWTDNNSVDVVKIIFGPNTYWYPGALTKNGNVYSLSLSDLAAKPTGYTYSWWANDTAGNTNQTGSFSYIINKATNAASLLIDGNAQDVTTKYPSSIHTITASASEASLVKLWNGNIDWTSQNGVQQNLKAGTYIFKANTTGNENYTADATGVTRTLTIAKGDQPVSLAITPSNNVNYPQQTVASATLTAGTGTLTLARDGNGVSNPETATLGAGTYVYNASVSGNENYTYNETTSTLTVNKAVSTATLTLYSVTEGSMTMAPRISGSTRGDESVEAMPSVSAGINSNRNSMSSASSMMNGAKEADPSTGPEFTIPDTEEEIDTDSTRADDVSLDYGVKIKAVCTEDNLEMTGKLLVDSNDKTSQNNTEVLLPAGSYDYNCTVDSSQNYTAAFDSATITINRVNVVDPSDPVIHLAVNGNEGDATIAQYQQVNVTGWKEFAEGSLTLYRNGTQVATGQAPAQVISNLGIGVYNYTVVYPETQNYTSGSVTRILTIYESEAPEWSENKSDTPSEYSDTQNSEFEITWKDNVAVDTVYFSSNYSGQWTNYTMPRVSGTAQDGQYEYQAILPSGYHCWKSYANDTSDNWNVTDEWCFTIDKDGTANARLFLDGTQGDTAVQYSDVVNVTATTTIGDLDVYIDGTLTYQGNSTNPIVQNVTMNKLGMINVTAKVDDTVSYNGDSVTYWINVTKKDVDDPNSPVMHIAINGTEEDKEMGFIEPINVTGSIDFNDGANAVLWRTNSTHTVNLGTVSANTPVSDIIAAESLPRGLYNYTLVYPGSTNYNAGSITRWLTINRTNITDPQNPLLHLALNSNESNLTIAEGNQVNATGWRDFTEGGNVTLYRDDKQVATGATSATELRNLAVGLYEYKVHFPGSENYTDGSVIYWVNVTKKDPVQDGSLQAWLNGTAGNISGVIQYPDETSITINATSWTNITGSILTIYRNGYQIGQKYSSTNSTSLVIEDSVGVGLHNYTFVISETDNYAQGSITLWANITAVYNWSENLTAGWNLISLPVVPTSPVLTSDTTVWGSGPYVIQHYNSTTERWYQYDSSNPSAANLTTVEPNWGYWVYVNNSHVVNVNGTVPSSTSVSLKEGLNMVGWTSVKTTLMKDVLASVIDDVDYVECQKVAGTKDVSQCYPPAGNSFEPGKGYFINMTEDGEWNYTDNLPPVANAGPDIQQNGNNVRLDASRSYDPDGTITAYRWIIGNTTVDGKVIDHNFVDGTYDITLIVVDNDGATNTDDLKVIIGSGKSTGGGGSGYNLKPMLDMHIGAPKGIDIAPGETKEITFTLKSTGQADIFGVEIDVNGPSDWLSEDSFSADTIKTGKSESFSFEVTVPEDQEAGEETITIIANANGLDTEENEIILNIKAEDVTVGDTDSDNGGDTGPTGLFLLDPNVIAGLAVILLIAIGGGYHYGKRGKTPEKATSKTTQLEATSETPSTPGPTKKGSGAEFSIEYK